MAETIELYDVQSNVLRGYRNHESLDHVAYVFLAFDEREAARAFVAEAAALATSCSAWDALEKQSGDARFVWNLGFTFDGLTQLGAAPPKSDRSDAADAFGAFSDYAAFALGAQQRKKELGDVGESAPEKWEPLYRGDLHALVSLSAWAAAGIERARAQLGELLARHAAGVREVGSEVGNADLHGKEHFGFADGIGQPDVAGSGLDALHGEGTPTATGWDPIPSGEFVLGYPNAFAMQEPDCDLQRTPPPTPPLLQNGSFLVFRKLREHAAHFRAFIAHQAKHTSMSEELFAARLIGRWRSGAPLALSPSYDDEALGRDPTRNNDFRFGADGEGFRTPFGAHIRRANPRDDPTGPQPVQIASRRLIRRSTPYGEPLPAGRPDDGKQRGILFVAINANIEQQFEFVQANWLNNTLSSKRLTLEADKDPIVGANEHRNGKFTIPGPNGPTFVWGLPRFVTVRGAAYFFLPGLRSLRALGARA